MQDPKEFANTSDNPDNNGYFNDEKRLTNPRWNGYDDEQLEDEEDGEWECNTEQGF